MNKSEILVRDLRNKSHYVVDDEYLNGYARVCGINATGVYNVLCRHADFYTQKAFPSIATIAEKLSIGKRTVSRALVTLEEWGIIKHERARHPETARWKHNSYTLLDKKSWTPLPHATQAHGEPHATEDTTHMPITTKTHMPHRHTKVSHSIKVTHKKDTHAANEKFEEFWKAYPRKIGKGAALRSWEKISPSEDLFTRILGSVAEHLNDPQWKEMRYIPHPATYLNQTRWDDEIQTQTITKVKSYG